MFNNNIRTNRYQARAQRKQMLQIGAVSLVVIGVFLNMFNVFSVASEQGMSFFEYLQVSEFGITIMLFTHSPVLSIVALLFFIVGFLGLAVSMWR